MNRLDNAARAQIVRCLCEGNSIRATARLCGCAINTVVKLLLEVGPACEKWHSEHGVGLDSLLVQVDEIWAFVGRKEKHADAEKKAEGQGDCWTWTALDADSKLMISWAVGLRDDATCKGFVYDLAYRLKNRIQHSSDGLGLYNNAVRLAFGKDVDYRQVVKVYEEDFAEEKRYRPAVTGDTIDSSIGTSDIDRQNLNIRMGCHRFARLTNAFSTKLANHEAALSLYFMYYNYCRPHQTLTKESGKNGRNKIPTTPAMAARLAEDAWTVEQMIAAVLDY